MTTDTIPADWILDPSLTRRGSTVSAYGKALRKLALRFGPRDFTRILDYGCGFGHGTNLIADRYPGATIDAYDSYPVEEWPHTATLLDERPSTPTYDLVVCIYVLNVLEPPARHDVVARVRNVLLPGGQAIFVARSWHGDVENTKTGIRSNEPGSILVPQGRNRYTYQKGYYPLELALELDWYLDTDVIPFETGAFQTCVYNKGDLE